MADVIVHGEGLVASAAALLLQDRDIFSEIRIGADRRRPVVECNADTIELLRLLLGKERLLTLKGGLIRSRLVRWSGSKFTRVDVNSCVLKYEDLIGHFASHLTVSEIPVPTTAEIGPSWILHSSICDPGVLDEAHQEERGLAFAYGNACISAAMESDFSILEAVSTGWIYMLPVASGVVQLQFCLGEQQSFPFTTDDLHSMLAETTKISHFVPRVPDEICWTVRKTAVRESVFAKEGELAIGDACATLSPISGDITGFGLRSALLAATSIDKVNMGGDPAPVLAHYNRRILRALSLHFTGYAMFLQQARFAPQWGRELDSVGNILADLNRRTNAQKPYELYLMGELKSIGRVSRTVLQ